jgi:hypothetical protein
VSTKASTAVQVNIEGLGHGDFGTFSQDLGAPFDFAIRPLADLAVPDMPRDASVDLNHPDFDALLGMCAAPGDPGNSVGVGRFCQSASDCAAFPNTMCLGQVLKGADFCTLLCTSPQDTSCRENAVCLCDPSAVGNCACIPAKCAP